MSEKSRKLTRYEVKALKRLSERLYFIITGVDFSKNKKARIFVSISIFSILMYGFLIKILFLKIISVLVFSILFMIKGVPWFTHNKMIMLICIELKFDYTAIKNETSIDEFCILVENKYLKNKCDENKNVIADIKIKYGIPN